MSPNSLMIIAIIVFALMLIGLILTVLEFRNGSPAQQEKDNAKINDSGR